MKRLPFGPWEPDKSTALSEARNVLPTADGYMPAKSFDAITPALPAGFLGGAAFVGLDGTAALLSGTSAGLYRYSGAAWSSVLTQSASVWRFAQFGPLVIAATGGAPAKFNLGTGTASALAGSPPVASLVATVRDFVFLAGDPAALQTVTWSGFNDAEGWTGGTNQAGSQLFADGGEIMGLAGGEYGLVIQRRAIKRLTYVGVPLVFQADEISSNIGCMAKGSVAQAGRLVFFLSERGFYLTDGTDVQPIGDERFNRWFFGRFSRSDIESGLTAAVDPRSSTVYWAMPGSPGVIIAYNAILQRGSYIECPVKAVFGGFTANVGLDAVDVLYPGGLEAIPVSLDSPVFSGGNPLLLVASPDNKIGAFSGATLEARITTPTVELVPGRRSRLRSVHPDTDARYASVSVDRRAQDGEPANPVQASGMRDNGSYPVRANGRHTAISLTMPAGSVWTYARGVDAEFEPEGAR